LESIKVNEDTFVVYKTEEQIKKRVSELAGQINYDYRDKTPIFISVLNGAFIFCADLFREITIECEVDFIKVSSYGNNKTTSGNIKLLKELNCTIKDRDIILVEDIVDTGISINFIYNLIMSNNPASLKVVTLLYKEKSIMLDCSLDYIGFKIPDRVVIGYGLDYAQKIRNLKSIYKIKTKKES
jgi:hypoxanthine phosphoribosyltransferase